MKKAIAHCGIGPIILMAAPTNSLDVSTLGAALTEYYQEHKEGLHNIMELGIFNDPKYGLNRQFTMLSGIEDELALDGLVVEDFLHQYYSGANESFNPTADAIVPDARILKVRDYEGDLQFADKQIQRTHLMWQSQMKQLAAKGDPAATMSFVEYLFMNAILNKANRTLRKAVLQATYSNTSGFNWNKILNGVEKVLADEVTATTITPVSISGATVGNIWNKIESVFDTLSDEVQGADDLVLSLDTTHYKLAVRADVQALGRKWNYDSAADMMLAENSNCKIVHEPDFNATKIAFWQKGNAYIGTHSGNIGSWEFQRFNRETKMMINGKIGVQFAQVNPGDIVNIAIGQ